MNIAVPFFNFLIYLVVGAIFIAFSPLANHVERFYAHHNNVLGVFIIGAFTYVLSYIIGLVGSFVFMLLDCVVKCIKKCSPSCKILHPRWDDYELIKKAKQFDVLYIYAREYNFRRSMSVVMLVLGVCSIRYPDPCPHPDMPLHLISLCIYFILSIVFLIATYQMTYKVANVLNKPFKFSPFNKRKSI